MAVISSNQKYLNPYQQARLQLQNSKFYSPAKWDQFAKEGRLPAYITTLLDAEQTVDYVKFKSEWEGMPENAQFDALTNELYSDKDTVREYEHEYTDSYGQTHTDTFVGTQYEYNKRILKEQNQKAITELEAKRIKEAKDTLSNFQKFLRGAWALNKRFGLSAYESLAGNLQVLLLPAAAVASADSLAKGENHDYLRDVMTYKPGDEVTFWNFFNAAGESGEQALNKYLLYNTDLVDEYGNQTNWGKMLLSTADSAGMMFPSVLINLIPGVPAGVGSAVYWTGYAGKDMHELANKYSSEQVSTLEILVNTAMSTAMEWYVSESLSKFLSPSIRDHLVYGHTLVKSTSVYTGRAILKRLGGDAIREGLEEILQDYGAWYLDRVFAQINKNWTNNSDLTVQSTFDAFSLGALSSLILGGGSILGRSFVNVDRHIEYKVKKDGTVKLDRHGNKKTKTKVSIEFGRERSGFKRDKDGNIILDKKGRPKYDHFGFIKSAALRMTKADIEGYISELLKDDPEQAAVTAFTMLQMLSQAYGELGKYRFEQAVIALRQMADIVTTTDTLAETIEEHGGKVDRTGVQYVTITDPITGKPLKVTNNELANEVWLTTTFFGRKVSDKTYKAIVKNGTDILNKDTQNRKERDIVREILAKEPTTSEIISTPDATHTTVIKKKRGRPKKTVKKDTDVPEYVESEKNTFIMASESQLATLDADDKGRTSEEVAPTTEVEINEKTDTIVIVPAGVSATEVRDDLDDQALVKQLIEDFTRSSKSNEFTLKTIVEWVQKITGKDNLNSVEALYLALFDINVFRSLVFVAHYDAIQFLAAIDQALQANTNISEEGHMRYVKLVAQHAQILVDYIVLQPNISSAMIVDLVNRHILTPEDLQRLRRGRWGYTLAKKIINGDTLTADEQRILDARIDNMAVPQDVKDKIRTNLQSKNAAMRLLAISLLNRAYNSTFMGPFDGITLPVQDTIQNRLFTAWLISKGYTIKSILNLQDRYKNSKLLQDLEDAGVNPAIQSDVLVYVQQQFELENPGLTLSTYTVSTTFDSYKSICAILTDHSQGKDSIGNFTQYYVLEVNKPVATISQFNLDLNPFLNQSLAESYRNGLTINDIIYNPEETLNEEILESIRLDNNGSVTPIATVNYLTRLIYENSNGKLGILVQPDFSYVLVDFTPAHDMAIKYDTNGNEDWAMDHLSDGDLLSNVIKSEYIEGPLGDTCRVYIRDLGEGISGYYSDVDNILVINSRDIPKQSDYAPKATDSMVEKINKRNEYKLKLMEFRNTVLHETQHLIQEQNRMAGGFSTRTLELLSESDKRRLYDEMIDHYSYMFKGMIKNKDGHYRWDAATWDSIKHIIYFSVVGEQGAFGYIGSAEYQYDMSMSGSSISPFISRDIRGQQYLITWWGARFELPITSTSEKNNYSKNQQLNQASKTGNTFFNVPVNETATEFDGTNAEIIMIDRNGNVMGAHPQTFSEYLKSADNTQLGARVTYISSSIQYDLTTNQVILPDKLSQAQYDAYAKLVEARQAAIKTKSVFTLDEYVYTENEDNKNAQFLLPATNTEVDTKNQISTEETTASQNVIKMYQRNIKSDVSSNDVLAEASNRIEDSSNKKATPSDKPSTKKVNTKRKRVKKSDVDNDPKLLPFRKKRKLLSEDMKKFIAGLDYARIDPELRTELIEGTLTYQKLVRYFRTTDLNDMNDYTFDQLCKFLFPNAPDVTKGELDFIITFMPQIYALGRAFIVSQNSEDLIDTATNLGNLLEIATRLGDPNNTTELAENYRKALAQFPGGFNEEGQDWEGAGYDQAAARMLAMLTYDGTVRSLYVAAVKLRSEAIIAEKVRKAQTAQRTNEEGDVIETDIGDMNEEGYTKLEQKEEAKNKKSADNYEDFLAENPELAEDEVAFARYLVTNTSKAVKIETIIRYQTDKAFAKLIEKGETIDSDKVYDARKKLLKKYVGMSETDLNKEYLKAVYTLVYGNLKGLPKGQLESLATNVRTHEMVIANIKGRAATLVRNLSPKEREVFDKRHPGVLTEDGKVNPDLYVDKPIEDLYELEDNIQRWVRLAKNHAFATQRDAQHYEHLEKENDDLRKALEQERKKKTKVKEEKIGTKKVKIIYVPIGDGFDVGSDRDMPVKLKEMLAIGFQRMRKTKVRYISDDSSSHPVVSRNDFLESCADILYNLSQSDVNEIVDYLTNAITLNQDGDDFRKYYTYKIFILTYFKRMSVLGQIELTDSQLEAINRSLEEPVSISFQIAKAWQQSMDDMNPISEMLKTFAKRYDIELDEPTLNDYIKALMTGSSDAVAKAEQKLIQKITEAYKYKYSRFEVYRFTAKHPKPHGFDSTIKGMQPEYIKLQLQKAGAERMLLPYSRLTNTEKSYAKEMPLPGSRRNQLFTNIFNFQRMAMLSSPGTWMRNISSNWLVRGSNIAADAIGNWVVKQWNKVSKKHKYKHREDQYVLQDKASQDSKDFVTSVKMTRFLTILFNSASKYESDVRRAEHNGNIELGQLITNVLINHITESLSERNLFGINAKTKFGQWNQRALNALNYGIMWMLADDTRFKIVTQTALGYIAKMLTEDGYSYHNENQLRNLNNFQLDLLKLVMGQRGTYKGVADVLGKTDDASRISRQVTQEVLTIFAEGYKLAMNDYMHRANFFSETVEPSLRAKLPPEVFWLYKQVFPFMNASWNWFVEGLSYTPWGILKGICDLWKMDARIEKAEQERQQGKNRVSPRFTELLAKRTLGKGIIGSIAIGAFMLLGVTGVAHIDDRDDKIKLWVGNVGVDVSDLFIVGQDASIGMLIGMMLAGNYDKSFQEKLADIAEAFLMDSTFADVSDMLRYGLGDYLTDTLPSSILNSFILNMWQYLSGMTYNTKVKYSSGLKGLFERLWVKIGGGAAIAISNLPLKIDPYTGEPIKKYRIPVLNDFVNRSLPIKFYDYDMSEAEKLAITLGIKHSQLIGEYKDIGSFSPEEVEKLNKIYGELNKKDLESFLANKTKYKVKQSDGTYKEMTYNQMSSEQVKNVYNQIMSANATIAKIAVWTESGHRYYASSTMLDKLKSLGYKRNVYAKTKTQDGFVT